MVSMAMASHHGAPQPWKVESVAPIRLNNGSRRFLKKSSMFRRFLFYDPEGVWYTVPHSGGDATLTPSRRGRRGERRAGRTGVLREREGRSSRPGRRTTLRPPPAGPL